MAGAQQTRINGRRAEVMDNTGPNKTDVPENCGFILEVAEEASVSVGIASGEENQPAVDECADARRFATTVEELLPPPR